MSNLPSRDYDTLLYMRIKKLYEDPESVDVYEVVDIFLKYILKPNIAQDYYKKIDEKFIYLSVPSESPIASSEITQYLPWIELMCEKYILGGDIDFVYSNKSNILQLIDKYKVSSDLILFLFSKKYGTEYRKITEEIFNSRILEMIRDERTDILEDIYEFNHEHVKDLNMDDLLHTLYIGTAIIEKQTEYLNSHNHKHLTEDWETYKFYLRAISYGYMKIIKNEIVSRMYLNTDLEKEKIKDLYERFSQIVVENKHSVIFLEDLSYLLYVLYQASYKYAMELTAENILDSYGEAHANNKKALIILPKKYYPAYKLFVEGVW